MDTKSCKLQVSSDRQRKIPPCGLRHAAYNCSGFTLVELITVVVLVGVLAALGGFLILTPITSFTDQARRAELTDIADNALQRISRELRHALPNSVRIDPSGTALEFLNIYAGGRYRARQEANNTGDPLVNCNADSFDVLGGGIDATTIGMMLVIYNTGITAADFNAYVGNNTAAITNVVGNVVTCNGGNFLFPIPPSSLQRFFVVDTPISYVCSGGGLWRYQNYAIDPNNQPVPAGGSDIGGVFPDLLADSVTCTFDYDSGPQGGRHGLASLQITATQAGESISLLYQTHVMNVP